MTPFAVQPTQPVTPDTSVGKDKIVLSYALTEMNASQVRHAGINRLLIDETSPVKPPGLTGEDFINKIEPKLTGIAPDRFYRVSPVVAVNRLKYPALGPVADDIEDRFRTGNVSGFLIKGSVLRPALASLHTEAIARVPADGLGFNQVDLKKDSIYIDQAKLLSIEAKLGPVNEPGEKGAFTGLYPVQVSTLSMGLSIDFHGKQFILDPAQNDELYQHQKIELKKNGPTLIISVRELEQPESPAREAASSRPRLHADTLEKAAQDPTSLQKAGIQPDRFYQLSGLRVKGLDPVKNQDQSNSAYHSLQEQLSVGDRLTGLEVKALADTLRTELSRRSGPDAAGINLGVIDVRNQPAIWPAMENAQQTMRADRQAANENKTEQPSPAVNQLNGLNGPSVPSRRSQPLTYAELVSEVEAKLGNVNTDPGRTSVQGVDVSAGDLFMLIQRQAIQFGGKQFALDQTDQRSLRQVQDIALPGNDGPVTLVVSPYADHYPVYPPLFPTESAREAALQWAKTEKDYLTPSGIRYDSVYSVDLKTESNQSLSDWPRTLTGRDIIALSLLATEHPDLKHAGTLRIENAAVDWPRAINEQARLILSRLVQYSDTVTEPAKPVKAVDKVGEEPQGAYQYRERTADHPPVPAGVPVPYPVGTAGKLPVPEPAIRLDSLTGSRFTAGDLGLQLTNRLQVSGTGLISGADARQVQRLLDGKKTDVLMLNDGTVAKLFVVNTPQDGPLIRQLDVAMKFTLAREYKGHVFSEKDVENLTRFGNMGRKVELTTERGARKEAYLGIAQATGEVLVMWADKFHIPAVVKGVKLSESEKSRIIDGKAIRLTGMRGEDNRPFNAYVRINAVAGKLSFKRIPEKQVSQQNHARGQRTSPGAPTPAVKPASDVPARQLSGSPAQAGTLTPGAPELVTGRESTPAPKKPRNNQRIG